MFLYLSIVVLVLVALFKFSIYQERKRYNKLNQIRNKAIWALYRSRKNKDMKLPLIKDLLNRDQRRDPEIVSKILHLRSTIVYDNLRHEYYKNFQKDIDSSRSKLESNDLDSDEKKDLQRGMKMMEETKQSHDKMKNDHDKSKKENVDHVSYLKERGIDTSWYENYIFKE